MYAPEKENLMKIRKHIATDPSVFESLIKEKNFVKYYSEIKGEKNKILPKEIKELGEKSPYVLNKQFYFMAAYESDIALRPDLLDFILNHFKAGDNLNDYFRKALS